MVYSHHGLLNMNSLPDTFAGALAKRVECHGDGHIRPHEMFEQPHAELEQAEIATVGAINDSVPSFTYREGSRVDDPEIRERSCNEQAR